MKVQYKLLAPALLAAFFVAPTSAVAGAPHTVQAGETLWSIAAANNFTTRALAAANGLPEDAPVVLGSTIQIPSEEEAAQALGEVAAATQTAAPPVQGAYTVKPGDTLSGIAAASGVSVGQVAWMNGLDPEQPLPAGAALKLPVSAAPAEAVPAGQSPPAVVVEAAPNPTPETVTASQIGEVASNHGVSPSLAAAVAWQESGFQNGVVSSANARGVMQILPGTWTWVEQQLAGRSLDPSSPVENVNAGVMFLRQLLADSKGDEATAVASYYQGAASVRQVGLLPSTQRYVANVMALKARFGG